eukprot:1850981-Prymnesium_polylepis.1
MKPAGCASQRQRQRCEDAGLKPSTPPPRPPHCAGGRLVARRSTRSAATPPARGLAPPPAVPRAPPPAAKPKEATNQR